MKVLVALLLCCSFALASKKPEPVYQDAVLKSFRTVANGSSCGGTTTTDNNTNSSDTRATCTDTQRAYYVIMVGDQTITVTPELSGKESLASMTIISGAFVKHSSLYGVLPNTQILIRSDSDQGKYHIKVGKRETLYKLVSAE